LNDCQQSLFLSLIEPKNDFDLGTVVKPFL
jgi:hypothetical protein